MSWSALTIGIDQGDRHSHPCLLDGAGTVVVEGRLATTRDGFGGHETSIPSWPHVTA